MQRPHKYFGKQCQDMLQLFYSPLWLYSNMERVRISPLCLSVANSHDFIASLVTFDVLLKNPEGSSIHDGKKAPKGWKNRGNKKTLKCIIFLSQSHGKPWVMVYEHLILNTTIFPFFCASLEGGNTSLYVLCPNCWGGGGGSRYLFCFFSSSFLADRRWFFVPSTL